MLVYLLISNDRCVPNTPSQRILCDGVFGTQRSFEMNENVTILLTFCSRHQRSCIEIYFSFSRSKPNRHLVISEIAIASYVLLRFFLSNNLKGTRQTVRRFYDCRSLSYLNLVLKSQRLLLNFYLCLRF